MKLNLPRKRFMQGPASVWKRILAFGIDMMVLIPVSFPLHLLSQQFLPKAESVRDAMRIALQSEHLGIMTAISLATMLIAITYFTVLEFKMKQTIGKMLMNIRVVSANKEPSFWQCLARHLFLLPIMPFVLLVIVDPLYLVFTNRRFSDIITKTMVIEYYTI